MKKRSTSRLALARVFDCLYPGGPVPMVLHSPESQTLCPWGMEETWAVGLPLSRPSRD